MTPSEARNAGGAVLPYTEAERKRAAESLIQFPVFAQAEGTAECQAVKGLPPACPAVRFMLTPQAGGINSTLDGLVSRDGRQREISSVFRSKFRARVRVRAQEANFFLSKLIKLIVLHS